MVPLLLVCFPHDHIQLCCSLHISLSTSTISEGFLVLIFLSLLLLFPSSFLVIITSLHRKRRFAAYSDHIWIRWLGLCFSFFPFLPYRPSRQAGGSMCLFGVFSPAGQWVDCYKNRAYQRGRTKALKLIDNWCCFRWVPGQEGQHQRMWTLFCSLWFPCLVLRLEINKQTSME